MYIATAVVIQSTLVGQSSSLRRLVNAKISTDVAAPFQQQRRPRFKFGCPGPRDGAISALTVDQGCRSRPETRIHARKGSVLAEISAIQGVAPPEAWRRLSLETDFSGPRGGAISALAVDQKGLCGPKTRVHARKGLKTAKISVIQGVAPPEASTRLSLEINFSGLLGGAISALAVAQGRLCGPETRVRARRKGLGFAERSAIQGVVPPRSEA